MFILELKPLLFLLSGSLCVFLTAYAPPSPLTLKYQLLFTERTKRRSVHILEWLYLLIWSVLRILFKSRQNSLHSLSCQEAAVLWKGGLTWEPCLGLSSKEGPCFLPGRAGGGWGSGSGSLRSQEKQVMRLTEEPEERCRDLKKASLPTFVGEQRGN